MTDGRHYQGRHLSRRKSGREGLRLAAWLTVFVLLGYVAGRVLLSAFLAHVPQPPATATTQAGGGGGHSQAPPPSVSVNLPSLTIYRAQVGVYSDQAAANKAAAQLAAKGFAAYVTGAAPYRVVAGIAGSRAAMNVLAHRLTAAGLPVYVDGVPEDAAPFSVVAGDAAAAQAAAAGWADLERVLSVEAGFWSLWFTGRAGAAATAAAQQELAAAVADATHQFGAAGQWTPATGRTATLAARDAAAAAAAALAALPSGRVTTVDNAMNKFVAFWDAYEAAEAAMVAGH